MEVMLRCRVPDRPGALAALAGAIGRAGGDIQAVDVVEHAGDTALDDLVVVLPDAGRLQALVEHVAGVDGVHIVHAGPSRGHPGDAVTRLAVGLASLLNGAMTLEHGLQALIGGLLRATSADLVDAGALPRGDARTLLLAVDERTLVLRRDHPFTDTERARAEAILRTALEAARTHTA